MTARDRLAQLGRVQNGRFFKIAATCVVVVVGLLGFISYVVAVHAPEIGPPAVVEGEPERDNRPDTVIDETEMVVRAVLGAKADPTSVGIGIVGLTALAVAVIWLGLGLTYVGFAAAALVVAGPLLYFEATRGAGRLIAGVLALSWAFAVLMQVARLGFSGAGPVLAVARNVLAEAVRMKLSVVFIVLLVFGLAALPGLLDPSTPLRYRVQMFLQYSTGGAFWLISILTLLFATATVAFEQRDKTIWQTMTKPVAPWQYLLGKWAGVSGLALVLLSVCGAAIFLFTEYLRSQPAMNEREAYVATVGTFTEDRLILETQVLVARAVSWAAPPPLIPERFEEALKLRIENEIKGNPDFRATPEKVEKIRADLAKSVETSYRTIAPGQSELFLFAGLPPAREGSRPLTFRYRIDSGSNSPDKVYRLSMSFSGGTPEVESTALGNSHTVPLLPGVVGPDGTLGVEVWNGDVFTGAANEESITFPAGGLEVSYAAGSYRLNFLRVMGVLWVKLAFLAMLGVCASTFLSFPVACLVAFGTFLGAESATFLSESLESYQSVDDKGKVMPVAVLVRAVAGSVAGLFKVYSDLNPTGKLVDGILLPWRSVAGGVLVLGTTTAALFGAAVMIFRKRELATYSGQ